MEVKFNVTGQERKSLVGAISQELNAPTKYLGAPTFAYEVGGYVIDKNGTVTGSDNRDLISDLQGIHSFVAVSKKFDEDTDWAEREMRRLQLESENIPDYSNRGQYGGDEAPSFEDLQMTMGEELGLGREHREDFQGENGIRAADVTKLSEGDESNRLIIQMPRSTFTDTNLENLKRLVDSKASLIKKALGTDYIPIITDEETVSFPWFQGECSSDEVKAYTHFVTVLCYMAKTQNRINATEKPVENEKYAFRCFLLRLGFIGSEFKEERKILLSRLEGSSAFRNPTTGGADNE